MSTTENITLTLEGEYPFTVTLQVDRDQVYKVAGKNRDREQFEENLPTILQEIARNTRRIVSYYETKNTEGINMTYRTTTLPHSNLIGNGVTIKKVEYSSPEANDFEIENSEMIGGFKVKTKKVYYTADGSFVPRENMSEFDILKTWVAESSCHDALRAQRVLAKLKKNSLKKLEWFKKQYKVHGKKHSGKKGNISAVSFDGKWTVEVEAKPFVIFGQGLKEAQLLMQQVINEELSNSKQFLIQLYNAAFAPSKDGLISKSNVQKLLKLQHHDERWNRAKALILEDMQHLVRKSYVRHKMRSDEDGESTTIHLNIARV